MATYEPTTAAGRAWLATPAGQIVTGMRDAILAIEDEAAAADRSRIYGHLVDRLWGCDADANAVLNIVEEPTPGPQYTEDDPDWAAMVSPISPDGGHDER